MMMPPAPSQKVKIRVYKNMCHWLHQNKFIPVFRGNHLYLVRPLAASTYLLRRNYSYLHWSYYKNPVINSMCLLVLTFYDVPETEMKITIIVHKLDIYFGKSRCPPLPQANLFLRRSTEILCDIHPSRQEVQQYSVSLLH